MAREYRPSFTAQTLNDIEKLKQDMIEVKTNIESLQKINIMKDLQEKKFSGKFMYSYEEIAQKNNVNKNTVQKTAEQENLTRRNLKIVGND